MKIIYIAGPVTGDKTFESIERNIREAEKYQIALANAGVGFFCPHTHTEHHSHKGGSAPETFYYELGFHFLKNIADAMLVMPNSEKSWGTQQEIKIAKEIGLKIFYPKNPQDLEEIIEWHNS